MTKREREPRRDSVERGVTDEDVREGAIARQVADACQDERFVVATAAYRSVREQGWDVERFARAFRRHLAEVAKEHAEPEVEPHTRSRFAGMLPADAKAARAAHRKVYNAAYQARKRAASSKPPIAAE